MTHNPLVNRTAISITTVLTIVVYQWRILSDLPQVSYLIMLHAWMLFSFIMAASTLIPSILYDHLKNKKKAEHLISTSRWLFPFVYIVGLIIIGIIYFLTLVTSIFLLSFAENLFWLW